MADHALEAFRLGGRSMIISLVLIEGTDLDEQDLGISLGNAKQIVVGRAYGFGIILHIAATTPADLRNALIEFAQIPGVADVTLLASRSD